MSEEQDFNIHDAMGFMSEEPARVEEINDNEEEIEEYEEVQQTNEEEQSLQDAAEEEIEEEEKPKNKKGRITELTRQKKELLNENELLKRELAAIRSEIQPLKNMAAGLDALGVNKKTEQPIDLDAQLSQIGVNPDDYDTDAEKRLALKTATLEMQARQQQVVQALHAAEEYVYNKLTVGFDEKAQKINLNAVNFLIQDKATDLAEDYNLPMNEAINRAKAILLQDAAAKSQQTGKDISEILLNKSKSLLSRRNIDLQNTKKPATINTKAREEVSNRAGKPNVDTIAIQSKESNSSDDFMSKVGFVGW